MENMCFDWARINACIVDAKSNAHFPINVELLQCIINFRIYPLSCEGRGQTYAQQLSCNSTPVYIGHPYSKRVHFCKPESSITREKSSAFILVPLGGDVAFHQNIACSPKLAMAPKWNTVYHVRAFNNGTLSLPPSWKFLCCYWSNIVLSCVMCSSYVNSFVLWWDCLHDQRAQVGVLRTCSPGLFHCCPCLLWPTEFLPDAGLNQLSLSNWVFCGLKRFDRHILIGAVY